MWNTKQLITNPCDQLKNTTETTHRILHTRCENKYPGGVNVSYPYNEYDLYTKLREVPIEHLQ